MAEETIYKGLTGIFREVFEDDELVVHAGMTAAEVPAWDSLSNIQMVVAVERFFNVKFTTAEISSHKNVGEFVASIMRKVG